MNFLPDYVSLMFPSYFGPLGRTRGLGGFTDVPIVTAPLIRAKDGGRGPVKVSLRRRRPTLVSTKKTDS